MDGGSVWQTDYGTDRENKPVLAFKYTRARARALTRKSFGMAIPKVYSLHLSW